MGEEQEQVQAMAQLKRAIIMEDYDKAEKLLPHIAGYIPQTTFIELQNMVAMARYDTDGETAGRLRAMVAKL